MDDKGTAGPLRWQTDPVDCAPTVGRNTSSPTPPAVLFTSPDAPVPGFQPYMRCVCPVEYAWVRHLLPKLHEVEVHMLSGRGEVEEGLR